MTIEHARNPLRRARLAAGLNLQDLADRTRISPRMLRHIDDGEFHRLPPGLYARAWVRSVAQTLALDPDEVLHELAAALPQLEEPEPQREAQPAAPAPASSLASTVAAVAMSSERRQRAAAAALDGVILSAVALVIAIITALFTGVTPNALGAAGAVGISALVLTLAALYFLVFAGIGGRTPGTALLGHRPALRTERSSPLDLAAIGRRAGREALSGSSIVVDALASEELTARIRRRHLVRG